MKTKLIIENDHGIHEIKVGCKTNYGIVAGFASNIITVEKSKGIYESYDISQVKWSKSPITWKNALGENETAFKGDETNHVYNGEIKILILEKYHSGNISKEVFTRIESAEAYLASLKPKWKDGDCVQQNGIIAIIRADGSDYCNCYSDGRTIGYGEFIQGTTWKNKATRSERQTIYFRKTIKRK